jgi:hypothetical protein
MNRTKRFLGILAAALLIAVAFAGYQVYATSLSTAVTVTLNSAFATGADLATGSLTIGTTKTNSFANGVGASQANTIFSDTRTVADGVTEDLDLAGGGLLDPFGAAFAPVKLRAVYIYALPANTTNLTLFGDANSVPILNTAATTTTLPPGGIFVKTWPPIAGIAVGAGATDIIQVACGAGAACNYDIILVGTTS